jgi:predicted DNA-binding protein
MMYTYIMSHRTQITLTDAQYARLKQESERTGLGLAEMVRRALGAMYGDMDDEEIRTALDESFGAWVERNFNGEAYVEALRPGLAQRLSR